MKLEAQNLAVARGEDVILSGVSFAVSGGEALVVEGPNGGGKSTLLRALAGLLPLEEGQITFTGSEEFTETALKDALHYLGHENAMKADVLVADNLSYWQSLQGTPHLDAGEALEMVGLGGLGSLPFGHLSTGQRRRVAIARLLVSWRPVWLLDEPTAGLDLRSQRQFAGLMDAHLEDGGLIIAATHIDLGVDRTALLDVADFQPSADEAGAS